MTDTQSQTSNSKSTKHALMASALALLLCTGTLAGTTYAWFTDSASTGVNKIQAGNLDMQVSWYNPNSTATDKWQAVSDADPVLIKDALWEPGHTEVAYFKVDNAGSLAFDYEVIAQVVEKSGAVDLSQYLNFGVVELTAEQALTIGTENALSRTAVRDLAKSTTLVDTTVDGGQMLKEADTQYVAVVVYMPETVGNDANNSEASSISLDIQFTAKQSQYESDSFGNEYDKNTKFEVKVPSFAALKSQLAAGNNKLVLTQDSDARVDADDFKNYDEEDLLLNLGTDGVLDLGGNTLQMTTALSGAFTGKSATIQNGTINAESFNGNPFYSCALVFSGMQDDESTADSFTLRNVTLNATAQITNVNSILIENSSVTNNHNTALTLGSSNLQINGGTYTSNKTVLSLSTEIAVINGGIYKITSSTDSEPYVVLSNGEINLTINDGEFEIPSNAQDGAKLFAISKPDSTLTINGGVFKTNGKLFASESLSITINGGTFDFDIGKYANENGKVTIGEGYEVQHIDGSTTWTVVQSDSATE